MNKIINFIIRKPTIFEHIIGLVITVIVLNSLINNTNPINILLFGLLIMFAIKYYIGQISLISAHYLMCDEIVSDYNNDRKDNIDNTKYLEIIKHQNNACKQHYEKTNLVKSVSSFFFGFFINTISLFTHYYPPMYRVGNKLYTKEFTKTTKIEQNR